MKRYLSLVVTLLFVVVLAACNQLPTDVIDDLDILSEELCRDNPDHELCDIENLSDVEETVVKDLVIQAIDDIQAGNLDTCEDIFAITNVSLLDDCEAAASTILPSDVESFEFVEAMKEGNSYIVKGNIGNDEMLVITVTVGEVEGNLRITAWSYERTETEEPMPTMTNEELINAMFDAYLSDVITDQEFNDMYFDMMLAEEFFDDRAMDIEEEVMISVLSITMNDEGMYEVEIKVELGEETQTSIVLIDVLGEGEERYLELKGNAVDNDCDNVDCEPNPVELEEVKMVLEMLFEDFYNADVTNAELGEMYFGGMFPDYMERDPIEIREVVIKATVQSISFGDNEDQFDIVVEITEDEETFIEELSFYFYEYNNAYMIEFDIDSDCDDFGDCEEPEEFLDIDAAYDFYMMYFEYYVDPSVSNQEFADIFFDGMLTEEFEMMRDDELAKSVSIELVSLSYRVDSFFDIEYRVSYNGDDLILRKRPGRIRQRPDTLVVEWDEVLDESMYVTDFDEAYDFYMMYFEYYVDPTVSNQEFADIFFDGMLTEEFEMMRDEELTKSVSIELVSLSYRVDSFFDIEYRVSYNGDDPLLRKRPGRIHQRPDTLVVEWDEIIDFSMYVTDIDEVADIFNQFIVDYLNPDLTDDEIYAMYFDGLDMEDMFDSRQMELEDGFEVTLLYVMQVDEITFELVLSFLEQGEVYEGSLRVKVKRIDASSPLLLIFDGEDNDCDDTGECYPDEILYNPDEIMMKFDMFFDMYLDPDSDMDVLYEYFWEMIPEFLIERDMYLDNGTTFEVIAVEENDMYSEEGFFTVTIMTHTGDETEIMTIEAVLTISYETSFGFVVINTDPYNCEEYPEDCYVDPIVYDVDHAYEIFDMYLQDFINLDLTFDEINEMYYGGMAPEFLMGHRESFLVDGMNAMILNLEPNSMYDSFFDITYVMETPTFSQEHSVTVLLHDYGRFYNIEFFDETNECHVDPEMCYYEEYYETDIEIVEEHIFNMFMDINNPDISEDELYELYFNWGAPPVLMDARYDGATYEVLTVLPSGNFNVDSFFDISYEITFSNGDVEIEMFTAAFYKMDGELYLEIYYNDYCDLYPEDCYMDDYETDQDVIEEYLMEVFNMINDQSITNDEINDMYFGWMAPEAILNNRDNGAVFIFYRTLPSGEFNVDSFFDIEYSIEFSDGTVVDEMFTALFYYSDMGLIIEPVYMNYYHEELLYTVELIFTYAGTGEVPYEEFCDPFETNSYSLCMEIFDYYMNNNQMTIIEELYGEDNVIYVVVSSVDEAGNVSETYEMMFSVLDNGEFFAEAIGADNPFYTITPE